MRATRATGRVVLSAARPARAATRRGSRAPLAWSGSRCAVASGRAELERPLKSTSERRRRRRSLTSVLEEDSMRHLQLNPRPIDPAESPCPPRWPRLRCVSAASCLVALSACGSMFLEPGADEYPAGGFYVPPSG